MNSAAVIEYKMTESEAENSTILDYLNEDCWRTILDYLPVHTIVRSERVSRQWQTVVLTYLRGVRIGIEHPYPSLGSNELHRTVSWLLVRDHRPYSSLESWTNKLGSSVATTFCDSEECLRLIGENCPNLEAVKFMDLSEPVLRRNRNEYFRWLQRICFIKCPSISDHCVTEYAQSHALEELEIHENQRITGNCFRKIKQDLKSLVLNQCKALESRYLQAALHKFKDLTKLVLNLHFCSTKTFGCRNIVPPLKSLHKLEHLDLLYPSDFMVEVSYSLVEAVCCLRHLKHLGGEVLDTDKHLCTVTKCCRDLRSLDLENCRAVTPHGVAVACRDSRLTALGFHNCRFSEDDIVDCVNALPDLKWLDVRRNRLSRGVIARVAAARRRQRASCPLHFAIDNIIVDLRLNGDADKYEQLILHF